MLRRSATGVAVGQHHLVLDHRHRLPGQRRLVDVQLGQLQQPQVGRDLVPRLHPDQVARHQLLGGHARRVPVADHPGLGAHHRPQRVQGSLGLGLLDEPHDRVDHHHPEDHAGIDHLPQRSGDHAGTEQDVDQRILQLTQEAQHGTRGLSLRQNVGPEPAQPRGRLRRAQTGERVSLQQQHNLVAGQRVMRVARHQRPARAHVPSAPGRVFWRQGSIDPQRWDQRPWVVDRRRPVPPFDRPRCGIDRGQSAAADRHVASRRPAVCHLTHLRVRRSRTTQLPNRLDETSRLVCGPCGPCAR